MADPFRDLSKGITEHITGGAPEKQYVGGSKEEYEKRRAELGGLGSGLATAGAGNTLQGVGVLGDAGGNAQLDRGQAAGMMQQGYGLGQGGLQDQRGALALARGYAGQSGDSVAQLQMRRGLQQSQQAMMAQAASARGGNQAAAMRGAQAQGSAMALDVNQQAAIMRAQEMQQRIARQMAVEQMAAQAGGQQANLGYGLATQGLGAAQQSNAQLAGVGAQLANTGIDQQNVGLGAQGLLNQIDAAQFEANRANASAQSAAGSPAAAWGGIVGNTASLWGGGGGGGQQQTAPQQTTQINTGRK